MYSTYWVIQIILPYEPQPYRTSSKCDTLYSVLRPSCHLSYMFEFIYLFIHDLQECISFKSPFSYHWSLTTEHKNKHTMQKKKKNPQILYLCNCKCIGYSRKCKTVFCYKQTNLKLKGLITNITKWGTQNLIQSSPETIILIHLINMYSTYQD